MLITAFMSLKREIHIICFLAVYVDDMGLLGNNLDVIGQHKLLLGEQFKIKDLGPVKQILGLVIDYDQKARILRLYQTCYIEALETVFPKQPYSVTYSVLHMFRYTIQHPQLCQYTLHSPTP